MGGAEEAGHFTQEEPDGEAGSGRARPGTRTVSQVDGLKVSRAPDPVCSGTRKSAVDCPFPHWHCLLIPTANSLLTGAFLS